MATVPVLRIKRELDRARVHTDGLFHLVRPDALYSRPVPERHRLIFYLGHLEAFDWNQVCRGVFGASSFHPAFDRLFAFGIDPLEGTAAGDQPSDWPSVEAVLEYNRRVRQELDRVLDRAPAQMVHVALEHRWMHAETLAYLLHNLPFESKIATAVEPAPLANPPVPATIEIPAGTATLGMAREGGFGWDNEFAAHTIRVPAFSIARHKVTNREYLEFVRDGAAPPHFWSRKGGDWYIRTMFREAPLPAAWPVWVTHQQAEAYARWVGKCLPTEAQFHRAAYGTPSGEERAYPWGNELPSPDKGNFDFARWDPVAVTASPGGDSAFGVSQLLGNGWEWTSSLFAPFPGFEPFPFYPGYSADFFDGNHYVMKGGSPRTAAALLRRSFRNWFRPNYPHMYSGFRLVEN